MRRRNCSTKTADLHHKSPQTDASRPFQYLFIEKITMFTTENKSYEFYGLDFRLTWDAHDFQFPRLSLARSLKFKKYFRLRQLLTQK